MMKRLILLFCLVCPLLSLAQRPSFSQPLLSPTQQFSALTGYHGAVQWNSQYRNQWPGLTSNYVTYQTTVDAYIPKIKSGIGFIAMHDRSGSAVVQTNHLGLTYSKAFMLGEETKLLTGATARFVQESIDWSQLVYDGCFGWTNSNQDIYRYVACFASGQTPIEEPSNGYELGGSVGIKNSTRLFLYQFSYLNQPSHFRNTENKLPQIHNFYFSQQFRLSKDAELTPSIQYKRMGEFEQLDFSLNYRFHGLFVGASYTWQDRIAGMIGTRINGRVLLTYSYDSTISPLKTQTLGSHELGMRWNLNTKKRKDVLFENLQLL